MADDIGIDPGAAGAAGANSGLWQLIAARRQAELLAEAQRRYEAQTARQGRLDAQSERRLDQADTRQSMLDERVSRTAKDAENKALLAQVTQFPGAQVTGSQLETMGVGKNSPLRGSQFKNLEEAIGGKSLVGMSGTAGTPQQSQGQITATPHAAVGPDTFEVRPTFNEESKTSAAAALDAWRQVHEEGVQTHNQAMIDAANKRIADAESRAANADSRRNTLTPSQTLNEVSQMNKAYNTNTKGERQIISNYGQMQNALKSLDDPNVQNQTAATKAIIDSFERTLNPMGVVRQTAFTQDVGHQSALDTLWGKWQQLSAGGHGMTPQNLKAFAAQVEPIARAAQQKVQREKTRITNMATPYGLPTDQIFAEEDDPFAAPATPAPRPGTGVPAAPGKSGIKSITLVP